MLESVLRPFFSSFFIMIDIAEHKSVLKIRQIKDKAIVFENEIAFDTLNGVIPEKIIKYIENFKIKHPFVYVASMLRTELQGNNAKLSYSKEDAKISFNDKWHIYTKHEILRKSIQETYAQITLDYLFSPFALIYHHIKDSLDEDTKMYILKEEDFISTVIANKSKLFDARCLQISKNIEEKILEVINDFYESDTDSVFINNVTILDTSNMSKQEIFELSDNLLLDMKVKRISLNDTILCLAQIETDGSKNV